MIKHNYFNALAGLWAFAIAILSLLPAQIAVASSLWDKLEHALAFFVLAGLIALARTTRPGLLVWAAATAYGGMIEVGQLLSPGRFADPLDALANALGAAVGVITINLWRHHSDKRSRPRVSP